MAKNENAVLLDPRRTIRANKLEISNEDADKLIETIDRALKAKKPAREDLQFIRKFLVNRPEFCTAVFGFTEMVQSAIIKSTVGDADILRIAAEEYLLTLRNDMGYHEAPVMEKLLIENIITCWLRVQAWESELVFRMKAGQSMNELEFWERRLSMAQRRYLAASESLAKIRKMALPPLQVNIGDQQINVAGNLQPSANNRKP